MARVLDWIYFLYFLIHIPTTILFDAQVVFPSYLFPEALLSMTSQYAKNLKGPWMAGDTPLWFYSFVVCELFLQLPFFFVAAYAFLKGHCRWIRIPAIMYCCHVITTMIPILFCIMKSDFSQSKYPGPSNMNERLRLGTIYFPFFFVPFMILLTMLFDKNYKEKHIHLHSN